MTEAERAAALADEIEASTVILEPMGLSARKVLHPYDRSTVVRALRAYARPVITDEMVEAAARAIAARQGAGEVFDRPVMVGGVDIAPGERDAFRADARAALEAAFRVAGDATSRPAKHVDPLMLAAEAAALAIVGAGRGGMDEADRPRMSPFVRALDAAETLLPVAARPQSDDA